MNTPRSHSRQCKWFPVCPMKRRYEEGRLEHRWIVRYCQGDWESCVRYQLEERGIPHPDTLLPDGSEPHDLSGVS